jgi:two-component system alkaline phosphatase synthesis response regulator PhoP
MSPKPKLLIVDDEKNIVEAVTYNLEREGFRTLTAADGRRALELARRELPDLIVLDWMLPEVEGLEVCRMLKQDRATRHIPVIMLTVRSSETDKVLGLEMGADDYLTKPFSPRELVARVKALLRRSRPAADEAVFQLDDLRADWDRHVVTLKGKPVELTPKEFDLLKALIEAKGRVLSREALLDRVWGYERAMEIETRTVDLHVSQLRRKLRHVGEYLKTVKNTGYRFAADG